MISHKYKAIYIHLPKCGGTSIEKALTDTGWHTRDLHPHQHLTAQETRTLYGDKIYDTYFKFTMVRNTWDLLVSHYLWGCWGPFGRLEKWFRKGGQWGHPYQLKKLSIGQLPTFEEYLSDIHNYNKALGFSPSQTDLTCQLDAICTDGQLAVDFVGRFENFQDDFNFVCNKIGFPPTRLEYANKSTRKKHYSAFYDEESKDFAAQKYKRDIDYFNFFFKSKKIDDLFLEFFENPWKLKIIDLKYFRPSWCASLLFFTNPLNLIVSIYFLAETEKQNQR